MNVGSLFSGIGGLDHGLARAGFRHAFLCESDPWRRDVLAHHFPGVPIYEDVAVVATQPERGHPGTRSADAASKGNRRQSAVDLLCGGFPCQDVSVAGRRAGLAGSRSGLFYEFARIAESLRPRWLLVENVPGLLSSNGGRDFGAVLGTLADIGYGVAWRVLDSRYFGVPQRRRRVFILGALANGDSRGAAERAGEILAVGTRCERHPATGTEARKDVAVASLSGLGSGGPDDNDGQGGRLVTAFDWQAGDGGSDESFRGKSRSYIVRKGEYAMLSTSKVDAVAIAAPLSHGSNPNSNMAGRRREDDENLVPLAGPLGGGNDGIGRRSEDDPNLIAQPLRSNVYNNSDPSMEARMHVASGSGVRRLTPTECERLQALPDDWTAHGPDSRRYAALGDAVTASVSEWIGRRLVAE